MSAQAPLDRLTVDDLYRLLDWLRDEWEAGFEDKIAKQLARARRHFEHLPERYWKKAEPLFADLGRARLVRNAPYHATIRALSELASEWERSRPPILNCEVCGVEVRGHPKMKLHRAVVHDLEDA